MLKKLDAKLRAEGYNRIASNIPEIGIYYKSSDGGARIIPVVDYHFGFHFSGNQYQNLINQIRNLFVKKGYEQIEMLSLILAWDVHDAGMMSQYGCPRWIIDVNAVQLLIYEDQPIDFYGLSGLVNDVIEEETQAARKKAADETEKKDIEEAVQRATLKARNMAENKDGTEAAKEAVKEAVKNALTEPAAVDKAKTKAAIATLFHKKAVINTLIVLINIIAFMVLEIGGSTTDAAYMVEKGAMFAPYVLDKHEYYRFITSMFMHFGIGHLTNNMLILFFVGDNLERAVGKLRYLAVYFISGLGGGVLSFLFNSGRDELVVSAGASGAIFGIIGAMLYVLIVNKGRLEDLTARRVGLLIFFSLYYGLSSSVIDNWAHIGGLIAGGAVAFILYKGPKAEARDTENKD